MKNRFLIFFGIFFLIFEIGFIFSQDSINFSAASTTTGEIAAGNFSANNFTGDFETYYNPSINSYEIEPYYCGDGICSVGENCSSCPADCGCASGQTCSLGVCTTTTTVNGGPSGGGGGGGGISVPPIQLFSLSTDQLNVKIQQGRVTTQEVIVTNNEKDDLTFEVSASQISNLVNIQDSTFTLKAGESKVVQIEIMALKNTPPNLYLGELVFKTTNTQKSILTAIEVQSANPIFDVSATIPDNFLYVMPGNQLYSNIQLYNLGEVDKEVDVNMEYDVMDSAGKNILRETEVVAVNTKIGFIKEFRIPESTDFGKYVLYVRATYNQSIASASAWFNVGKAPSISLTLAIIIFSALALIALIIIFLRRRKLKKRIRYKIDETALKGTEMIKR